MAERKPLVLLGDNNQGELPPGDTLAGVIAALIDPWQYITLATDVTASTNTYVNVTGLLAGVQANQVYEVEVMGFFHTVATTTGLALALSCPAGSMAYGIGLNLANATGTVSGFEQVNVNSAAGPSSGARAANLPIAVRASWLVVVGSTAGSAQLILRSEVASSAVTLKAGTVLKYRRAAGATAMNVPGPIRQVKTIPDATYELVADDADSRLLFTASSAVTVTVPNGVFDAPRFVLMEQAGAGKVTVVEGSGMTINDPSGMDDPATRTQFSTIGIAFSAASSCTAFGDLEAPPP